MGVDAGRGQTTLAGAAVMVGSKPWSAVDSGAATSAPRRTPRTFASPVDAIRDLIGVARRTRRLTDVYLRGGLDPDLRERVMVAVSRVNSCHGCTFVHESWAGRTGVSRDDLEAIGMGDLGVLDDRNRAAVAYAAALAETRFRRPIPADLAAGAADQLAPDELAAIDAVARAMALANLSVNTVEGVFGRLHSRRTESRHPARFE